VENNKASPNKATGQGYKETKATYVSCTRGPHQGFHQAAHPNLNSQSVCDYTYTRQNHTDKHITKPLKPHTLSPEGNVYTDKLRAAAKSVLQEHTGSTHKHIQTQIRWLRKITAWRRFLSWMSVRKATAKDLLTNGCKLPLANACTYSTKYVYIRAFVLSWRVTESHLTTISDTQWAHEHVHTHRAFFQKQLCVIVCLFFKLVLFEHWQGRWKG